MGAGLNLFALGASREFGARVAKRLEIPLAAVEERDFEDGEHKTRALVSVRQERVFVIHSLYGDDRQSANDKLCRLLFFIASLREAGAERVTAVLPYLCYARKDRRTQPNDPVTTKYVAWLFEAAGTDSVILLDIHNPAAEENAFRCRLDHIESYPLFVAHFARRLRGKPVTVVAPDFGGAKRAELFRAALEHEMKSAIGFALMEKMRSGGVVSGEQIFGDVSGRPVIIIDDLISTGGTLARVAASCRQAGATEIHAAAAHGLFHGGGANLAGCDGIVVLDTVPPFRLVEAIRPKVTVLDSTPLFAEKIV